MKVWALVLDEKEKRNIKNKKKQIALDEQE
jgi:hypothetical protein